MIIRLSLFVLLMLMAAPATAADAVNSQVTMKSGDVLRGHFSDDRQMAGFNGPMHSEGHFVVAPGKGLIWATEKPFRTTVIITPDGLAQTVGNNRVFFLPAQKLPFLLHLYAMLGGALAGDWAPLKSDFAITENTAANAWTMTLTPLHADDPAMPYNMITASGSRFVASVILKKPSGDQDTLSFTAQTLSEDPLTNDENAALASVHQ